MKPTLQSRIRGSVLAQAWGDALGAPFEFAPPDAVEKRTGKKWLVRLHPFTGKKGPHGMWTDQAPAIPQEPTALPMRRISLGSAMPARPPATQSAALADMEPSALVDAVLALDPLCLGGYFGDTFIRQKLPPLLARAAGKKAEELAEFLAWELRHFSVFDPFRALAIAFAALLSHPDDPSLALQVAANQGDLDEEGHWSRYADIDCYAGITGALVGACCGDNALPADVVGQVVAGNKAVYGFDLEETIARFVRLVVSKQGKEERQCP